MKIFTNVVALTAATLTEGQLVETKGYYTAGDGGQARYLIKTAADYGAAPDEYGDHTLANGNVAVLQYEGAVNVKQFGAKGDGNTDDTAALQATIDYAVSLTINSIEIPQSSSYYIINGLTLNGSGIALDASKSYLRSTTANNMFTLGETSGLSYSTLRFGRILNSSSSYHIFENKGLLDNVKIDIDRLTNGASGYSIFKSLDTDGGSLFFTEFTGGYWAHTSTATVPAFDIEGATNTCAANKFTFRRAENTGSEPYFSLKCTGAGQYFYSNIFDVEWEKVDGGALILAGCAKSIIKDGNFYDMGTTTKNLINLTSSGGNGCVGTEIHNVMRNSGTLGASLYDVLLGDATDTLFINTGSHSSSPGVTYNINGKTATIINPNNVSFVNEDLNMTLIDSRGVNKLAASTSIERTISGGVIDVFNSYHRVDTEADAVTDDLDTISNAVDGMLLTLQSAANARDIVVKNGTGNIILLGGADFTLSRVSDTLQLVYTSVVDQWCEVSRSDNQT